MPKRVPKIRFKKYTDEWKEDILSEFLEVSKEKNFLEKYDKTDVLSVSGECGIVNQIEHKGRSFAGASVANYGVVDTGDVVYTKSPLLNTPYGIIKTNKGKLGIVSTLYAVYKPKENVDPSFIECYFEQNARINNYLKPLVNKGAKNDMKVTDENALKGLVAFPDKKEQTKIAKYLVKIENLILDNKQKCAKIKIIKQSLLQKLFTYNEECLPKIHYKNYNEKWNKNFLNQYLYVCKEKNILNKYYKDDVLTVSREHGVINQIEYKGRSYAGESLRNYGILQSQNIVYTKSPLLNAPYGIIKMNKGKTGIVSALYAIYSIKDNADPNFIECYFQQNERTNNYLKPLINKGAKNTISVSDENAINGIVIFPSKKVQIKIGYFLNKIDELVELYDKKVEKLVKIKKAFLEQMFA